MTKAFIVGWAIASLLIAAWELTTRGGEHEGADRPTAAMAVEGAESDD